MRSFIGWKTEKPYRRATDSSMLVYHGLMEPVRDQGRTAPSAMECSLLGMTRSVSISIFTPRPVQSGQAP